MTRDDKILIALLSSIVLFPLTAYYSHRTSLFLFGVVFFLALVYHNKFVMERYDRMDFFPWNEVNIVKKRIPQSTVIDCAWRLDQKDNDIFNKSDPVLAGYSDLSSSS